MKPETLYKTAAGLLALFGILHTVGFLRFKPPTPEGLAVRDAMSNVHFTIRNTDLSYGGFYQGFGLFVTVYLLFAAFLAWRLASRPDPVLGRALCGVQLVSLAISWAYFSAPQVAFSALLTACIGFAAFRQPVTSN